ncbi:MAG: hypothetical protein V5A23_05575 [Halobacteriales archaeon]
MASVQQSTFSARTLATISAVGVFLGLIGIGVGGAVVTTVSVMLIIIGVISLLLAVGVYLGESTPGEPN